MIGPTGAVRVMMATKPVDFRKGAEGLAALVRETMAADPFSRAVYVFRAKRADRIKLVFWDGTGLCLFAKRLEDGIFRWPKIEDGVMRLSAAQLSALLEGLDWRRVHEARRDLPVLIHPFDDEVEEAVVDGEGEVVERVRGGLLDHIAVRLRGLGDLIEEELIDL